MNALGGRILVEVGARDTDGDGECDRFGIVLGGEIQVNLASRNGGDDVSVSDEKPKLRLLCSAILSHFLFEVYEDYRCCCGY
ncbi:hypothetical protein K1719_046270 [Acacia pycnantha]|nr:hypothetical protein K1719_046270 [Acacia pycnantha]